MAIYLSYSRNFAKHTTVMFSIMYALISYNIVQTMNPMWLDGVFALPLVVMGIEALLREGKYKLLIFSLVYSFITCFYIGYMIAIFSVLYYIYYALTSRRYNMGNVIVLLKRSALFACAAIIAAMLSAFILLPVYSALSMGKLEFTKPDFSIKANFDLLEISRKLFLNSYDTVRMPEGMPFLFSGTLALLLLPAYFTCDRIRRARRTGGVILMFSLIISMMIVPVDMFWHGMQNPNWLPYRYSFMFCFLVIAFGAEAFERIRKVSFKTIGISAAMLFALLIYWQAANTIEPALKPDPGRELFDWLTVVMPAMAAVVIFAVILILARDRLNKYNMISCILIALIALELLYNTRYSLEKQHVDIHFSSRASFASMITTRKVMDGIIAEDDGFWRSEKQFIRSACDSMAVRQKGITHSSSMLNDRAIDILKSMGYAARSHASRYSGNTPLTDDLFGFKYVLSLKDGSRTHDNAKEIENIVVNVNHDVMDIAYLVHPKMWSYTFTGAKEDDVFANQNRMLSYMIETPAKKIENFGADPQNMVELNNDYLIYTKMRDFDNQGEVAPGHLEFDFYVDIDGHFYAYFPSDVQSNYTMSLKHSEIGSVHYDDDGNEIEYDEFVELENVFNTAINAHYIGEFVAGEHFTLRLTFTDNRIFLQDEIFLRASHEDTLIALEPDAEGNINHNAVAGFITGLARDGYFSPVEYLNEGKRSLNVLTSDGEYTIFARNRQGLASLRYDLYAIEAGDYFAHFPGSYTRMFDISVNGAKIDVSDNADHIYYLGYFDAQTEFNVTLTAHGDEIYFQSSDFAWAQPDNTLEYDFDSDTTKRYYKRILSYLKTIKNDGDSHLIRIETPAPKLTNIRMNEIEGNHTSYEVTQGEGTIEYTLRADAAGEYYAYFPTDYHPSYYLTVNGARHAEAKITDNLSAHYLGDFAAGETFTVTLHLTGADTYFSDAIFARVRYNFAQQGILRNQSRALSVLQGSDVFDYLKRITPYDKQTANLNYSGRDGGYTGYLRTDGGNAHIEYSFTAEADGDVYMYFPSSHERRCNLWLKIGDRASEFRGQVYETDHHHIHYVGYLERGQDFMITLSLADDNVKDVFFRDEGFVRLDRDLLEADIQRLHKMNENTDFRAIDNRHLRIKTNHPEERMLFTSIPNEPGWTITVNGKKVEVTEIRKEVGLIAITVPAGENTIDLKFFPNYMPFGIVLFFVGIGGFIGLNLFLTKYKEREQAILERQTGSKSRGRKRKSRALMNVRDEYDGYDPDYMDIDPEDDDFDFDVKDDVKNDSDD